ncbi:MAG: peptidyl-prolyl cis-trans isomerase [Ignavibacteriales bacterium]|nr:peptidyl-prolyl cis-trans isomerase [Ignavibacteriales bacterium]
MKINYLLIVLLFIVFEISAQTKNEIVAKVGDVSISKEEFKKRFEFSPHPRRDNNFDTTLTKLDFLKTLIAEKLLAKNAVEKDLDKTEEFISAYRHIRNLYLRDALYRKEVKEKIAVPDSEFAKGKRKILKTLVAKFIFSDDEKEINDIYNELKKGASFDSILATRPESKEQKNAEEITFGKLNEKIEDAVFNLNVGEISKPLELKEGWYIFKVYSFTRKGILDETDLKKIERVVTERWENKTYENFYKNFFKKTTINADRKLFDRLYEELKKFIHSNEKYFVKKNGKFTLFQPEISKIEKNFSNEELNSVFVKFKEEPVKFKDFLTNLKIDGFDFLKFDDKHIHSRLNSTVFIFIQNELLAREALKRKYDELPDVAFDLKLWKDNFLSNLNMKQIYKTVDVSDEEAYNFFAKNNRIVPQPEQIKIAEILTNNLDVVKTIFDELDKGTDFKKLVEKYSIRDSLKQSGGEYDYTPANKEGEIWKAASNMKVGEVFGPIKTDEGYSIIKLLDRKESKQEQFETFEQAKDDIKNILRTEKMYKQLEDVTAKLAIENKIELNENVLKNIKVNPINMIVYKRFGFGGQYIATPYQPNFSSWYKTYEYLKKLQSL